MSAPDPPAPGGGSQRESDSSAGLRLLVPVSESTSLRSTVDYVVGQAIDAGVADSPASVHFVSPVSERLPFDAETETTQATETLLERVRVWAEEDRGDNEELVEFETTAVGTAEYLFSPADYAEVLVDYAREHAVDRVVFDPGFNPLGTTPLLPPLQGEVSDTGVEVEEAPVRRERRSPSLDRQGTLGQLLSLFGVSYGFYLLLAGSLAPFELVTGAITAGVVATTLWGVSLTAVGDPLRTVAQLCRFVLYVPYLLWEVVKANLTVAYVVLHPKLPIDPAVVEFDAAVQSPLMATTLANSITLTPGTLTVDVSDRHFTVHTLTESSREDLLSGSLERAVRSVFFGRAGARIPTPTERRQTTGREDGDETGDGQPETARRREEPEA